MHDIDKAKAIFTAKHVIAVLVFQTIDRVTLDGLLSTTTKIDVTKSANGTFQPRSDKTTPGRFTTVTAFLNSQEGKQLGPPIAGTFFYVSCWIKLVLNGQD